MEKMRKENVYIKGDITGCRRYVALCRIGDAPASPPAICKRRIQSYVRTAQGGGRPGAGGGWWGESQALSKIWGGRRAEELPGCSLLLSIV